MLGLLALGDHAVVVAATEQATARYPLRGTGLGAARARARPLGSPGRGARRAAPHPVRAGRRARPRPGPGAARPRAGRARRRTPCCSSGCAPTWSRARAATPAAPAATARRGYERPGGRTVGREAEEAAALEGVLDRAAAGEPAYALLVGEPGIGKSRLVERLAESAAASAASVVATGRCAQDDGAPPLWPWSQALRRARRHDGRALDAEVERLLSGDAASAAARARERQAFRAWESIAHEVLTRSEAAPGPARARGPALGRHRQPQGAAAPGRARRVPGQQLAVRRHPAAVARADRAPWPTSARSSPGDHVVRLDLAGLTPDEAPALVADVTRARTCPRPGRRVARALRGQPVLPRSSSPGSAPTRRRHDAVPATVRDVVVRRLRGACPSRPGRCCSSPPCSAGGARSTCWPRSPEEPVDDVDDLLAPAREAGLVLEPEAGTRRLHPRPDPRRGRRRPTTASRLARLHARVAHALADGGAVGRAGRPRGAGGRAGPALAGRRTVVRRARLAGRGRRCRAGPPDLLVGGGRAARRRRHRGPPRDPAGTRRRSGSTCCSPGPATAGPTSEWDQVLPCAAEAIALARREEDLPRLAAAAAAATDNLVWMLAAVERGARGHRRGPALGAGRAPRRTTRPSGAG